MDRHTIHPARLLIIYSLLSASAFAQIGSLSAASRRMHATAGSFDINLPLSGSPAIEPRQNGAQPRIVLNLSSPPVAADGTLNCGQEVEVINGSCHALAVAGNTLIVDMTFNRNACVTVQLFGLLSFTGDNNVSVRTLEGDGNGDGAVDILDLASVKGRLNLAVNAATFRSDVTVNGKINILDLQAVKGNLGQVLGVCPSRQFIVSPLQVVVGEGQTAQFAVTLSSAPPATETVTVSRVFGSSAVTIQAGATLTFTTSNYSTPHPVTLAASLDANKTNETATIRVRDAGTLGIPSVDVSAKTADIDLGHDLYTLAKPPAVTTNCTGCHGTGHPFSPQAFENIHKTITRSQLSDAFQNIASMNFYVGAFTADELEAMAAWLRSQP